MASSSPKLKCLATGSTDPVIAEGSILLVDDDPRILRAMAREVRRHGHATILANNGVEAIQRVLQGGIDLVVTDMEMPGLDGIGLVHKVREHDARLPIVVVTGNPTINNAISALNLGVTQFLIKPFGPNELTTAVNKAVTSFRLDRLNQGLVAERPSGEVIRFPERASFDRALDRLYLAFQPIVNWPCRTLLAHEALVRSNEPDARDPGTLFGLAERLGEVPRLGRSIRNLCASALPIAPEQTLLFVNLHAADLLDPHLIDPASPLVEVADRVVLEVSERCSMTNLNEAQQRIRDLRALGFRIALDDIGAGYAGLNSFALLEPDVVKLDMVLVRNVDQSSTRQRLIEAFVTLCKGLNIMVVAEGVETQSERDTLLQLGCDLFQGYLFGRPQPEFSRAIVLP